MAAKPLTNLELVQMVDSWPYYLHNPTAYRQHMQNFYYFYVAGFTHPVAYIFRTHAQNFPWSAAPDVWEVDHARRRITLTTPVDATPAARSAIVNAALRASITPDSPVKGMRKWRDEQVPVFYSPTASGEREHVMNVDRCAFDLIAFSGYGVHMTGWTRDPSGAIKIWVPRRSYTKSSYPGMLDNTVGGTLRAGEAPIDCIIREAEEELCIPPAYTRSRIVPCGMLAAHLWRPDADPDAPYCERQIQYVYEIELDPEVQPRIGDGEVAEVTLMSVDEVQRRLAAEEFKHNTVQTYLAFFIRRGIITAENEPNFEEVVRRMHRPYDIYEV